MPSSYIDRLATEALAKITPEEWQRTSKMYGHPLTKPASVDDLKRELRELPALQAHLAWKTGYTPSKWLVENELEEIKKRRARINVKVQVQDGEDAYKRAGGSGLAGICFSGGGIRSATFNLGILQGLAELNLLKCFDYLSSVSGGGYIHQWFAAWSKRRTFAEVTEELIPLPEPGSPPSHPEPLRWLRRYSNYLTPERGLFSADAWVAISTWLRNTLLNQIILISGLLFLVMLPHTLTLFHPAPGLGAALVLGLILYLFLAATFFIGKNLYQFGGHPATDVGLFGQKEVQLAIVIPLLVSSMLFALLFPMESRSLFLAHLGASFVVSGLLLLALSLAVVFWGGAPLSYLQSHHRTAGYTSFGEFWRQPKCWAHVRMIFVLIGLVLASGFAGACGAGWIVVTEGWLASLRPWAGHNWWRLVLVIDPPLALIGILLSLLVLLGLLGRTFSDGKREWLGRLSAGAGFWALSWILAIGFSLFASCAAKWFTLHSKTMAGSVLTWAGTSLGGLVAGKSSKTMGTKDDESASSSIFLEILATVAPYVFIAGLLLLLAVLAEDILNAAYAYGHGWGVTLIAFLAPLVTCLLFAWRVDINEFSMQAFYRNRLARCYLGASNTPRDPNPFSGFDERDAEIALSQLRPDYGYDGPFPIFCTTMSLTVGQDLAWQERKAASFAFTPLYSGYDVGWTVAKGRRSNLRFNGYVDTSTYAYPQPGIHVSTAAAVSGAALSPNSGFHTNPATAFLMTIFNVRLGWWLRNPRSVDQNGKRLDADGDIRPEHRLRGQYPSPSPNLSLLYLCNELLGRTDDASAFVYLSDGGHFDNMGLYELVRRRCRYIVICDAESDGSLTFSGIGMAIRKCRIDFGAEIALDLRPLQPGGDRAYSSAHCVVGTIRYPEDKPPNDPEFSPGIVVYIKSSLTGDEPADILNYEKEHAAFPHDTTMNQWFTESQFESYRRLGHHAAISTFDPARPSEHDCEKDLTNRSRYFWTLRGIWYARTPEMDLYSSEHSKRYAELLRDIRTDPKLPGFYDRLFTPADGKWSKDRSRHEVEHAKSVSSDLFEFIFVVFFELNLVLPEKRDHPFSKGWYRIFAKWAEIDVVRDGWLIYRNGYSSSFQLFAQKELGFPGK